MNWTAVNGATVYSLKVVNANTGEPISVPESPFNSPQSVTVEGLSPGTFYNLIMESIGKDKSDPLTKTQLTGSYFSRSQTLYIMASI